MIQKVLIVGDKPSKKNKNPNIPFIGTKSYKRLQEWIKFLEIEPVIINQSMYPLFWQLKLNIESFELPVIALGNNASNALRHISHFKLPHPSFRNRLLNSKKYKKEQLDLCKNWLRSEKTR